MAIGRDGEVYIQYRGQVEQIFRVRNGVIWDLLNISMKREKFDSKWTNPYQRWFFLQYSKGFDLVGSAQMGKEWIAVRSQDLGLWLFSLEDEQEPILLHQNIRFQVENFSWSEDGLRLILRELMKEEFRTYISMILRQKKQKR